MHIKTDGIVIREMNLSENDKLITVLSRGNGVFKVFANGARRVKSDLGASSQLLAYSGMTIYRGKDKYIINEAETKEMFFSLRSDVEKLFLAQYFCELFEALSPREQPAEEYLRLMLNALHILSEDKRPALQIKAVTELRLLSMSGYMPDLVACAECASYESDVMYFFVKQGNIVCGDCHKPAGERTVQLHRGVLTAMRHSIYSEFPKLFSFALPEPALRQFSGAAELCLLAHTESNFPTLSFFKDVADLP